MPVRDLKKSAAAMPPKTAPAIADEPSTPLASRYGVPEPDEGLVSAASILRLASSRVSSSVFWPVWPWSPTLPMYAAYATPMNPRLPMPITANNPPKSTALSMAGLAGAAI